MQEIKLFEIKIVLSLFIVSWTENDVYCEVRLKKEISLCAEWKRLAALQELETVQFPLYAQLFKRVFKLMTLGHLKNSAIPSPV